MHIAGIGVVFCQGRGVDTMVRALESGRKEPEWRKHAAGQVPVYAVTKEALTDKCLLTKMRRSDRFSRLAVFAAVDAFTDSQVELKSHKENLGIILSTAIGPHATTFSYIDDILKYGDSNASPIRFSHSVHNAATSYIASVLQCRGPIQTISQFGFSFHHALNLAAAWLNEGRCDYVLAGSVDECSTPMEYIISEKAVLAEDGIIRPFIFSSNPVTVPGEGGIFLLLTKKESKKYYCSINGIFFDVKDVNNADVLLLDCDGMSGDDRGYLPFARQSKALACYTPIYGGMICNSAFSVAAGSAMLYNQVQYPCPVTDTLYNLPLCRSLTPQKLRHINCLKINSYFKNAFISLERQP